MSDVAFELLAAQLNNAQGTVLWVVDENLAASELSLVNPRPNIRAITNRYNVAAALRQQGFDISLSDFEANAYPAASFETVGYRVSKEKAIVHHIINSAAAWLKPGGQLYLSGFKNDGCKTYIDKAAKYLGELVAKSRGANSAMIGQVVYEGAAGKALDDKDYSRLRLLALSAVPPFFSKPGLFGWNKIDKGSAFLIAQLPRLLDSLAAPPQTVIDLGCGYGYLSMMANELLPARFIATDNNIAAVAACRKNFAHHGIKGEVILDDCGGHIEQQADLLICNPPFHQGFDVESSMTDKFLDNCRRLLAPQGTALFVVNAFIPLERKASEKFSHVERFDSNPSFKLVVVSR